jgi:hypothetical protein
MFNLTYVKHSSEVPQTWNPDIEPANLLMGSMLGGTAMLNLLVWEAVVQPRYDIPWYYADIPRSPHIEGEDYIIYDRIGTSPVDLPYYASGEVVDEVRFGESQLPDAPTWAGLEVRAITSFDTSFSLNTGDNSVMSFTGTGLNESPFTVAESYSYSNDAGLEV